MILLPCDDLDPRRVPLFPLPTFDAHRSKTQERDRAVAFAEFDSGADGRDRGWEVDERVDPEVAREGKVERIARVDGVV